MFHGGSSSGVRDDVGLDGGIQASTLSLSDVLMCGCVFISFYVGWCNDIKGCFSRDIWSFSIVHLLLAWCESSGGWTVGCALFSTGAAAHRSVPLITGVRLCLLCFCARFFFWQRPCFLAEDLQLLFDLQFFLLLVHSARCLGCGCKIKSSELASVPSEPQLWNTNLAGHRRAALLAEPEEQAWSMWQWPDT